MPRQLLGHRTAHHIAQRERKLLADLVDQAVGQALEHRRQAFAQAELQQPVDLALHVAEHLQHDLLLQIGRQRIGEFHSKGRPLNVPEIFIYSSNVGSARMALKTGAETQFAYFERFGFHRALNLELP